MLSFPLAPSVLSKDFSFRGKMLGPRGSFTTADYMVLVLVLALSGAIGAFFAYKSRKSVNNKEFLVGNRKLQVRNQLEDKALSLNLIDSNPNSGENHHRIFYMVRLSGISS